MRKVPPGVREFTYGSDQYRGLYFEINGKDAVQIKFKDGYKMGDFVYDGNGDLRLIEQWEIGGGTLSIAEAYCVIRANAERCCRCDTVHGEFEFCQCYYHAADEQQKEKEKMEIGSQKKFWIVKKRPNAGAGILPGNTYQNRLYTSKGAAETRARGLAKDTNDGYIVLEVVGCFDVTRVNEVPVVG